MIAFAAWIAFGWSHQLAIEDLRQTARRRMEGLSETLLVPSDKYSYLPGLLATHPVVLEALLHENQPAAMSSANRLLEDLQKDSKAAAIYVVNANGRAIASSNWRTAGSFIGHDFSYRPYFRDALRTGEGRFYGMGVITMVPGYFLSHAVRHEGQVLGVAVVKVEISGLDAAWRDAQGEANVADENGVVFLSSRRDWKYRPMRALDDATLARLKRTRQYEDVLKSPMRIRVDRTLGKDQQLVTILPQPEEGADAQPTAWYLRSGQLGTSGWTVDIFLPLAAVEATAQRAGILSAGVLGFLLLSLMYVVQLSNRRAEREAARQALSEAHQSLELKHGDLQKVTEDLRLASITDSLTGAYNRRYFHDAAAKMVSAARRHGQPLSVVVIDADHFKRINDRYGHAAGDKALQELTAACRDGLREEDLFARFGGEEFILLLPNTDSEAARAAAERVRRNVMERQLKVDGEVISITVSSGVSQWRPDEPGIDVAIRRADRAVYVAKDEGRNRVVVG